MKSTALALAISFFLLTGCDSSSTSSDSEVEAIAEQAGASGTSDADSSTESVETSEDETVDGTDDQSVSDGTDTDSADADVLEEEPEVIDPPVAVCEATDVGIAFTNALASSVDDPDRGPVALHDGCVDRAHGWSGDSGTAVTLDAGDVQLMQGVYLWSTFGRLESFHMETSVDGSTWRTEFLRGVTKPETGPVYYPFADGSGTRYVRMTWYGSDLNGWSNINEVRWSLTGYNVQGSRVYRHEDNSTSMAMSLDYTTYGIEFFFDVETLFQACYMEGELFAQSVYPTTWVDATGQLGRLYTETYHDGVPTYFLDFDHYVPLYADHDNWLNGVSRDFGPNHYWYELREQSLLARNGVCASSSYADYMWGFDRKLERWRTGVMDYDLRDWF